MMVIEITGAIDVQTQHMPDGNTVTKIIVVSPTGTIVAIPLDAQGVSAVIALLKGHKPVQIVPAGAMPSPPSNGG